MSVKIGVGGGGTNMQMGDTYMMEEVYIWSIEI